MSVSFNDLLNLSSQNLLKLKNHFTFLFVQECQRMMEDRLKTSKERVANLEEEVETKHQLTLDLTKQVLVSYVSFKCSTHVRK